MFRALRSRVLGFGFLAPGFGVEVLWRYCTGFRVQGVGSALKHTRGPSHI